MERWERTNSYQCVLVGGRQKDQGDKYGFPPNTPLRA